MITSGNPQKKSNGDLSGDVQYVIDGGALLHRVPWTRGTIYESVIHLYVRYVTQKYSSAAIVFDGYKDGPTTRRHTSAKNGIKSKKDDFLKNKANKQRFIPYISDNLKIAGSIVDHTKEITCHIVAFCFDALQFGAFHFGDFHFDAILVRRVSLWRASTSARFSLPRFHFGAFLFGAFPNFVSKMMHSRLFVSFLRVFSAKKCCLRQFAATHRGLTEKHVKKEIRA